MCSSCGSQSIDQLCSDCSKFKKCCKLFICLHAPSVCTTRPSQKKDLSPDCGLHPIKLVKGVSIVNHCLFAPSVESVPGVVETLPVGGRLQLFWRTWASRGLSPRVVSILKEGYALPFKIKPPLTRSPMIVSSYANPLRDFHLQEALHSLLQKLVVEKVRVRSSLAFYNHLFLVPKPNNKWRPILDLSTLNRFLRVKSFKMETPESIQLSLQQGEWVTSLDFSDAYFHIPVHPQSRKYLRFHYQGQTYQFKVLPFGLLMAPMEFTVVVKEVKLMAQNQGIRIHQYLDDWLIRGPTKDSCHQDTQTLLALCQELGWLVNLQKSELEPKQIFNFIALIHPIQWTIANPVGADRPAKRQKKTSCVSTSWPVPVLCIRQVAHGIYFLSRQHDVSIFFVWRVYCANVFSTISRYFKEKCAL